MQFEKSCILYSFCGWHKLLKPVLTGIFAKKVIVGVVNVAGTYYVIGRDKTVVFKDYSVSTSDLYFLRLEKFLPDGTKSVSEF